MKIMEIIVCEVGSLCFKLCTYEFLWLCLEVTQGCAAIELYRRTLNLIHTVQAAFLFPRPVLCKFLPEDCHNS